MSFLPNDNEGIYELLWAFHDGSLSAADALRLRGLVLDNPCVRQTFVDYAFLRGGLEWNQTAKQKDLESKDSSGFQGTRTHSAMEPNAKMHFRKEVPRGSRFLFDQSMKLPFGD
jgi:hypothetical protein